MKIKRNVVTGAHTCQLENFNLLLIVYIPFYPLSILQLYTAEDLTILIASRPVSIIAFASGFHCIF